MNTEYPKIDPFRVMGLIVVGFLVTTIVIGGSWFGIKAMARHQKIADANNRVKTTQIEANNKTQLNRIRIAQQSQLIEVAKKDAQIRLENALGIRKAQDEIAATLTPLYVQFEMIEALKDIAHNGKNSSLVYIPSGPGGLPIVAGAPGQPQVGFDK